MCFWFKYNQEMCTTGIWLKKKPFFLLFRTTLSRFTGHTDWRTLWTLRTCPAWSPIVPGFEVSTFSDPRTNTNPVRAHSCGRSSPTVSSFGTSRQFIGAPWLSCRLYQVKALTDLTGFDSALRNLWKLFENNLVIDV